jgi:hypothetical protein
VSRCCIYVCLLTLSFSDQHCHQSEK